MATESKKLNDITTAGLGLTGLKSTAVAILAGEYEDPDGIEDDVLKGIVKTYAERSRDLQYELAKKSENPMEYLVKTFFYPTIRVKGKGTEREIEDSTKRFDLIHAFEKLRGNLGADAKWVSDTGDLCTDFAFHAAHDLGDAVYEEFLKKNRGNKRVLKLAKAVESGKNPVSKSKLYPALDGVIQQMLGSEHHISKYDYNFIDKTFINDKANSARAVTDQSHKGFVILLMKVCYRILSGETGYVIDSKLAKKEK